MARRRLALVFVLGALVLAPAAALAGEGAALLAVAPGLAPAAALALALPALVAIWQASLKNHGVNEQYRHYTTLYTKDLREKPNYCDPSLDGTAESFVP
jgi:hypothetical protein